MYCKNCGKKIDDDTVVCPYCGTQLRSPSAAGPAAPNGAANGTGQPRAAGAGPRNFKSSFSPKTIGLIAIAAVVLLVVIVLGVTHKTKLNLNKYVTISWSGCNGYGTAKYTFDSEKFVEDYGEKMTPDKKQTRKLAEFMGDDVEDEDLEEYYDEMNFDDLCSEFAGEIRSSIDLEPSNNLSNGDKVTLSWDKEYLSDEAIKEVMDILDCRLSYSDITKTVDGLKDVKTVDPFEDLKVSFSGSAPYGTISVENDSTDEMVQSLNFYADKEEGLSNGDTVTISADVSNINRLGEKYGEIPDPISKTYTVEGLGSYVQKAADLQPETLKKMQEKAEELIKSKEISEESNTNVKKEVLSSLSYLGSFIVNETSDSWNQEAGKVYLVYKVNVEDFLEKNSGFLDTINTCYTYCSFDEVIKMPDGSNSLDYGTGKVCDESYLEVNVLGSTQWTYYGYEDLDSLRNQVLVKNYDSSEYEDTVEDIQDAAEPETKILQEIPSDAKTYNGHSYALINLYGIDYDQAKDHCEQRGGHLAVITSQEEEDFIKSLNLGTEYWLGASREDGQNWTWVTGEAWSYTNWKEGQPASASSDKNYLGTIGDAQWESYWNSNAMVGGYICEWDKTE